MLPVLFLAPSCSAGPVPALMAALRQAGHAVEWSALDGGPDSPDVLWAMFGGRPPEVLVADLTHSPDCLPLRHAGRLLQSEWGDALPSPVRLALFTPRHLAQPDWPAYTDDFLLPPYEPLELLARLSLASFRKLHIGSGDLLLLADLVLDLAAGCARDSSGLPLTLTPREFELLRFLSLHRGKFFARDRLLDMVWGVEFGGGERTVDIHIRRLRAKMPPQAASLLETRRGLGYGIRTA